MESFRQAVLLLLFFTRPPESLAALVLVPTALEGIQGGRLLIPVTYNFSLENVTLQGMWYIQGSAGDSNILVSFHDRLKIDNMKMESRGRFFLKPPNGSLLLDRLDWDQEGLYRLDVVLKRAHAMEDESHSVKVIVHVPVSRPRIELSPLTGAVEERDNVTWRCWVEKGSRVRYHWLRNNQSIAREDRHIFSADGSSLTISPVQKEDIGEYVCVASNAISSSRSEPAPLSIFYGPYNVVVRSVQGRQTGEVFTVSPGETVFFDCWADSNPPYSCVWISKRSNSTHTGPQLEILHYDVAYAEEYVCRAFNNVTQKQDETQFTLVVTSGGGGKEMQFQEGGVSSPLMLITVTSLLIIGCMLVVFFWKSCHPHRVIMDIYNRPLTEQKRGHLSGHEDATEDFGIYEFVAIPGRADSTQASTRSLAGLNSVQDLHTTIYDVIRHIPDTPAQSLLK